MSFRCRHTNRIFGLPHGIVRRCAAIGRAGRIALSAALLVGLTAATASAQYEDLLRRIPATANAIMVVNVKGLHDSPLGRAEGWKDQMEESYAKRPLIFPPDAEWAVLGSMFDPNTNETLWDLGVMSLTSEPSMLYIARAEGGYSEKINGAESAWTPSNAYFVQIEPKQMGVMFPANRQLVSRWIDFARSNKEVRLSPYLKEAAELLHDKTFQAVLALDLKDMVRPHMLREKLANSETLKGKKVDLDALQEAIETIQGVTLTISLQDKAYGRLKVDFASDVKILDPFGKQLVLEALADAGAQIDVLEDWKYESSVGSVSLVGVLSTSALRRIGSLLELPSTKFATTKPADAKSEGPTAEASKTYFTTVQTLVDDLRKSLRDNRDNHAVWMERYARKIDRLPILNVDDELLAFGAQTAERLRKAAVAKRSGLVRAGVRKSETYNNYVYGDYGYTYNSSERQKASIQFAENAASTKVRIDEWKAIEDDMAQVRQAMTKKYMVEF